MLTIGIAGLGAVGAPVARRLAEGVPGLVLGAIAVRDPAKVAAALPGVAVRIVDFDELAFTCDVVVEALPRALFRAVAVPAIERGRVLVALTAGAFLDEEDLIVRARTTGARIIIPSGALLGLDAVRAASEGTIRSATIETRKPPAGLLGAPYLERNGISLDDVREPLLVFSGSAREGARGFPANVNVAAALSLAGIGPDRTRLDIWADPNVTRNTHRVTVDADSTRFTMQIEGVPSEENPRTGKLTPLSTIATLRGLVDSLRVGT
ncbi:MAG TPA: aspartate dehydrogenase [Candidatus Acidoferrales bacterium]|nr:aspartate dehydrogenase [Candidatus Acidoferrales bacterium]